MLISELVLAADAFAAERHWQQRKYTNEPYIIHPRAVMNTVRSVAHTEEMLAAALLHDTVEDCGVTESELEARFGPLVSMYVMMLSDVSRPEDGNRAVRKHIDKLHVWRASPAAKTIKLADLLDNTESIVKHDPGFAVLYMQEKRDVLPGLIEGDRLLFAKAQRIINSYFDSRT